MSIAKITVIDVSTTPKGWRTEGHRYATTFAGSRDRVAVCAPTPRVAQPKIYCKDGSAQAASQNAFAHDDFRATPRRGLRIDASSRAVKDLLSRRLSPMCISERGRARPLSQVHDTRAPPPRVAPSRICFQDGSAQCSSRNAFAHDHLRPHSSTGVGRRHPAPPHRPPSDLL